MESPLSSIVAWTSGWPARRSTTMRWSLGGISRLSGRGSSSWWCRLCARSRAGRSSTPAAQWTRRTSTSTLARTNGMCSWKFSTRCLSRLAASPLFSPRLSPTLLYPAMRCFDLWTTPCSPPAMRPSPAGSCPIPCHTLAHPEAPPDRDTALSADHRGVRVALRGRGRPQRSDDLDDGRVHHLPGRAALARPWPHAPGRQQALRQGRRRLSHRPHGRSPRRRATG